MSLWQLWLIIGFVVLILDVFAVTMFLVNVALALFLTSIVAYFGGNIYIQLIVLTVFSTLFLLFLRPLLIKKLKSGSMTGVDSKYYGQTAKVIQKTTNLDGRIAVYGEEWRAHSINDQIFEAGETVKIVGQTNMIMMVDKL